MTEARILYRLYTEDRPNIAKLTSQYFHGFTLLHGTGHWRGISEPSIIVEHIGRPNDRAPILFLAEDIRRVNEQQAVYVSIQPIELLGVTRQ